MPVLETGRERAAFRFAPGSFFPSIFHQVRDAGEDDPFLLLSEDLKRELSAGQIYRRSLREFLWCSGRGRRQVGESWGYLREAKGLTGNDRAAGAFRKTREKKDKALNPQEPVVLRPWVGVQG